jgi:hypothetical protein
VYKLVQVKRGAMWHSIAAEAGFNGPDAAATAHSISKQLLRPLLIGALGHAHHEINSGLMRRTHVRSIDSSSPPTLRFPFKFN